MEFKNMERESWLEAGCEPPPMEHLVKPSGSLGSPLAHHLHQPSYTISFIDSGETADDTNGCMLMVMGNGYKPHETLVFDHIHRRSLESNGLQA